MRVGRVAAIGVLVLAGAAFAAFEAGGGMAGIARWRAAWRLLHGAKEARVAAALGLLTGPEPVRALERFAADPDVGTRIVAAVGLGNTDTVEAVPVLLAWLAREESGDVRALLDGSLRTLLHDGPKARADAAE